MNATFNIGDVVDVFNLDNTDLILRGVVTGFMGEDMVLVLDQDERERVFNEEQLILAEKNDLYEL